MHNASDRDRPLAWGHKHSKRPLRSKPDIWTSSWKALKSRELVNKSAVKYLQKNCAVLCRPRENSLLFTVVLLYSHRCFLLGWFSSTDALWRTSTTLIFWLWPSKPNICVNKLATRTPLYHQEKNWTIYIHFKCSKKKKGPEFWGPFFVR